MLPPSLVGESHLGGFICVEWELRITIRCLTDDLGVDAEARFEDVSDHEMIRTFVKDRFERSHDTRQVSPLSSGREVWVLARGNDHRGGTWFDRTQRVVWLVAYARHRSGTSDDFFPYCKDLDASGALFPEQEDYKRLIVDRDHRFVASLRIEAPLILKDAREQGIEQRRVLGGECGACIAVEVDEELEATTVAFEPTSLSWDLVPVVLAAFHPGPDWTDAHEMPSRPLAAGEVAFKHVHLNE